MLEEDDVDLAKYLLAPMPGMIVSVNVKEGQKIKSGEVLLLENIRFNKEEEANEENFAKEYKENVFNYFLNEL